MEKDVLEQKKELVYDFINTKEYVPLKFKEMAVILGVPASERTDLRNVVNQLTLEGKCSIDQQGKIQATSDKIKTGVFSGTQKGFGFVTIEGEPEDIFIPAEDTKGAMHQDRVQITIQEKSHGKRKEGAVIRILKRATDTVVGTFCRSKNFGFVVSDNQKFTKDIFIPKEKSKGAVSGHKVVVELINYGNHEKNPEGRVVEIIGHQNDPGVDIVSIIRSYSLPEEFSKEVMKQTESIPEEVDSKEIAGRIDVRSWQTVTIDGEDAKDLDDAISIMKENGKYKLGVHIADVTHYVEENSPLDKEAVSRGTSVYLADRVIPMLPHTLSNGICSLNEGVDRLALSCIMEINEKGNVIGHQIAETVIHVDRRMSYTSINKIIGLQDEEETNKYKEFVPMFEMMKELAELLKEARRKHGSIDFDFPESKIILDKRGKPVNILPYERNIATRIIEEFMLITNETIAEDYFWQEIPFVYRCHEQPEPEKMLALGIFINNFGYHIRMMKEDIHPKEIQKLIEKIAGTPEENVISRLTLRSMKRANYSPICDGHFGLATKYYCHFTSPIRRYPDLQIHRIIKENIHGGMKEKRREHYHKILTEIASCSSRLERRAEEAEREVDKLKKAEYMEQFIGEEFEGVISGITNWGMYVELSNTVEGMVRVADIQGDSFVSDDRKHQLIGEHTKKTFALGERIQVKVLRVDRDLRAVDFEIANLDETARL